ncbi:MAG: DUF1648 domain-containing protein [Atopobiaceae bacterium]|jgi:uncharacterized membrane protein|nr:DUF1648 domain-containing protein [Atopobiaceae bacterium]MCH4180185.1 DUF1648 domain-containing protein [Atopobiaceae bacterium]MCH4214355.1 DUF1648 domain-containing protein [Atopobiaceae bacterium]MCH4229214.1 DUF1648 domain-containing protein [Atopobiaceae bacterium]MCH4276585.1 DUF1648 domain-containing protein [Atopobiaceae bacterium]
MDTTFFIVLIVGLVPLTGIFMALTPWLMRRQECFAVTVPVSAQADPIIGTYKRRYTAEVVVLSVVSTLAIWLASVLGGEAATTIALTLAVLAIVLVSFLLMLHYRKLVMQLKEERGWRADTSERAAVVGEADIPQAVPLAWELLNVPVICGTALVGVALYPSMPDQVPMHMDLSGAVTSWADKSPLVVVFPVLIQVVILAAMAFSHYSIVRSKRPVDPTAPVSSALAYGLFAHAQSVYLVVFGLLIDAVMVCLPLSFAGVLSIAQAALVVMVVAISCVVGALALSLVYGQAGSRIAARVEGDGAMVDDDDEHWKLGVFYFDAQDPSLFLPERFGVGWTVNYARPAVWAIIAAFVVTIIALLVVSAMMV